MSGGDNIGYPSGVSGDTTFLQESTLILDCDFEGIGRTALKFCGPYHVAQDCSMQNINSYGVYGNPNTNCAYIGINMQNMGGDSPEYTMRLQSASNSYIAYCDFKADYIKCNLNIRGDESAYNYVWNNQFDRATGIHPQNQASDENLHHNTFDSNIIVARDYSGNTVTGYAAAQATYDQTGTGICTKKSMYRNNIIYGFTYGFVFEDHALVGSPEGVWLHNNTVIGIKVNSSFSDIDQESKNIKLRNNVFYSNYSGAAGYGDRFLILSSTDSSIIADPSQIDSEHNIFFEECYDDVSSQKIVSVVYNEPSSYTLPSWQSELANDTNSQFENELLDLTIDMNDVTASLNNGFATVASNSPAIDAGDPDMIYTKFDFFGNERSDLTIGAIGK